MFSKFSIINYFHAIGNIPQLSFLLCSQFSVVLAVRVSGSYDWQYMQEIVTFPGLIYFYALITNGISTVPLC